MSDRIELSRLGERRKQAGSMGGKSHEIAVTGSVPAELDIVILRARP